MKRVVGVFTTVKVIERFLAIQLGGEVERSQGFRLLTNLRPEAVHCRGFSRHQPSPQVRTSERDLCRSREEGVLFVATVEEIKLSEVLREQELIVSVFTCLRFESCYGLNLASPQAISLGPIPTQRAGTKSRVWQRILNLNGSRGNDTISTVSPVPQRTCLTDLLDRRHRHQCQQEK